MAPSAAPLARSARRRRAALTLWAAACLGPALVALAPPVAAAAAVASSGPARIGRLTVVHAFLPLPPSPYVAAVYLTVKNSGPRPDALVSVSTDAAMGAMLMTENPDGSMGIMRQLVIPAHGQASLVPGRDHLMLEIPRSPVRMGQRVPVTLRFARAGSITIRVPVVPLSSILAHPGS
ncbi:MAG TPA: copper chaperone PCu(A)C [Acidimicrobiales bacterium]|nr:copper chaperone PCu(A)C [Acidimicrobiales bacterium]